MTTQSVLLVPHDPSMHRIGLFSGQIICEAQSSGRCTHSPDEQWISGGKHVSLYDGHKRSSARHDMSEQSTKPGGHCVGVGHSFCTVAQVPSGHVTCVDGQRPDEESSGVPWLDSEMHRLSLVATKPGGQVTAEEQVRGDTAEQVPSLQRMGLDSGQGMVATQSSTDSRQVPPSQRTKPGGQRMAVGQRS